MVTSDEDDPMMAGMIINKRKNSKKKTDTTREHASRSIESIFYKHVSSWKPYYNDKGFLEFIDNYFCNAETAYKHITCHD